MIGTASCSSTQMTKKSTKTILVIAALLGSQTAAIMLWQELPSETLSDGIRIVFTALAGWLFTAVVIFVMTWLFFNLLFAFGRWVWERFYRTPTL